MSASRPAPTHVRVAACADVYVTTVSRRAAKEDWKTLDFRRPRVRAAHRAMIELAALARAGEELDAVAPEAEELECVEPDGGFGEGPVEEPPQALEPLSDEGPEERIARIGDILTRRTDAMLRRVEAGRPLEGRQVAALAAMVQLAERIAVLAREQVVKKQKESEDELRETLKKIDDRIVYLARCHAQWILVRRGMSEEEAREAVAAETASG
jgi:hypothetical protein